MLISIDITLEGIQSHNLSIKTQGKAFTD